MTRQDQDDITIHQACRNDYEAIKKRLDKLEAKDQRDPRLVARDVLKFEDPEAEGSSTNSNSSITNYPGTSTTLTSGDGLAVGLGLDAPPGNLGYGERKVHPTSDVKPDEVVSFKNR